MKIRTDFVTNSSSSSFVLEIIFTLTNDQEISLYGENGDDGDADFYEAFIRVSPKQLGTAKNIEELVKLLKNGTDIIGNQNFILDFIEEIKSGITSMDEIESIKIIGNESNYMDYDREFTYNLKSKEYKGDIWGEEFEKNGSSGGGLYFSDLNECDIWHEGDDEEE